MKTIEQPVPNQSSSSYDYINGLRSPEQRYTAALIAAMAMAGVDMVDLELATMIADENAAQTTRLLKTSETIGLLAVHYQTPITPALPAEVVQLHELRASNYSPESAGIAA